MAERALTPVVRYSGIDMGDCNVAVKKSAHGYTALRWVILALALSNVSSAAELSPMADANLVLVVVDALRADHLGTYGYKLSTSPFIDELAESSVLFESAISSASQTVPAVLSLMSSRYPNRHENQYFPRTDSLRAERAGVRPKIPQSLPILAEVLKGNGFRTAAIVTNPWLNPRYGFDRGFESYRYLPGGDTYPNVPDGSSVNREAQELLEGFGSERFFLYLHYMDVHNPYEPSEPHKSTFVGSLKGRNVYRNGPAHNASRQDVSFLEAHYDGAIRSFDDRIREFHQGLQKQGLLDKTLFVLVSDHGDEFHEHGGLGHGWTLYDEMVRVPLLFWHPVLKDLARRIGEPVSAVDLLPTLLELLGVERPADLDGISLAPWILGRNREPAPPRRVLLSELAYKKAAHWGSKKLIWTDEGKRIVETFDLAHDPKEMHSLDDQPAWVAGLARALEVLRFGADPNQIDVSNDVDSEEERRMEERLRMLGYAGRPAAEQR